MVGKKSSKYTHTHTHIEKIEKRPSRAGIVKLNVALYHPIPQAPGYTPLHPVFASECGAKGIDPV